MRVIPVIHCFDHNYVLPAAVCFHSLLEHATTPNARYAIYAVGRDFTDGDRALLSRVVARFPQAELNFLQPGELPIPAGAIPARSHYSSELFGKLILPELFPELDKAIVADVDVVYLADVAGALAWLGDDDSCELAGVWDIGYAAAHGTGLFPTGKPLIRHYLRHYSAEERELLRIGAGFMVCDFRRLRASGRCREWVAFACENARRSILPEQEAFGLVRGDLIRLMPLRYMAIAEHAPAYDGMTPEERAANPCWDEMYAAPVQLHYASKIKPWKYPGSACAELWFGALVRAGLVEEWRRWYADWSKPLVERSLAKKVLGLSLGRFRLSLVKLRKRGS